VEQPADRCFRRQYRLLTPAHYAAAFAARRVLRGAYFSLHYRNNGLTVARLGLVIPKKQARSAVLRNAIKRQIREVFRVCRHELPAVDLVLRLTQPVGRLASGAKRAAIAKDSAARRAWREEIAGLFASLRHKVVGP
jgi:ribonuclease P protein component